MNIEKKSAIIGAIWGLISIIKFSPSNNPLVRIFGGQNAVMSRILTEIVGIPITISSKIFVFLVPELAQGGTNGHAGLINMAMAIPMIIFSILIGALIGYGIAKIYLKIKTQE